MSIANEVAALTSANACAGVGVVACPPIPSWNVEAIIEIGLAITQETVSQAFLFANLGVSYQSASGDYAEWLERVDPSERIDAGDIVGVFGGKIAKSTTGAEQILVVSRSPIVLGNMPKEGQEYLYDKVAFLGQVPVKVTGVVNEGDYIIPSGFDDGSGIAVSPELMTADEYAKVVGRAWSGSRRLAAKYVNAAIGLNSADVASLIQKQQTELAQLKAEMRRVSELDAKVERLQRALEKLQGAASIAHGTSADGFAATVDSHR